MAFREDQLYVCRIEKFDFPKLCQKEGLGSKNVTLDSSGVLFIFYLIILPNGLPLSCLFYADDLVKAKYPQYCNQWVLKINRKITKKKDALFV